MIDESDLDILELEEERDSNAFSVGRLIAVAAGGALASLGMYYVYQQMDPEKRERLKKKASSLVADQIHALTDLRPSDDEY